MSGPGRIAVLTLAALCAFAANSILCRLALGRAMIDPISYTVIRLLSGALMLALLARAWNGSWRAAAMLLLYAAPFSLAYVELTAGTGALIAFSAVQLTMIGASIATGRHPRRVEWIGIAMATLGLYILVRPGLSAPSPAGAVMMALAGTGWGFYSLIGRGSVDPLRETAGNFARCALMSVGLALVMVAVQHHTGVAGLDDRWFPGGRWPSTGGVLLAVVSGAVTSALGYVIWYAALRGLTATRAALVQTSVPVLSAVAGIIVLGEPATPRLAIAGTIILAGILMTIVTRQR